MTIEYKYDHSIVTLDNFPDMRFIVHHDTDASDPIIESGAPVEHYVVRSGYHSSTDTPRDYMSEAFARFNDEHDDALVVTRRFARIFHGYTEAEAVNRIALVMTRGYSQSDWAELFVHVSEEGYGNAEGWAEEWAQWARGDVFGVCPERYIPCEHPETCHGDEEDHWLRVNDQGIDFMDLWGIYADDAEEAVKHFVENYL